MRLYHHPASPFVRKVRVFAAECGLSERLDLVPVQFFPKPVTEELAAHAPLSKVPVLVTDDDEILYDSHVICEYLDTLHDRVRLFPQSGLERWRSLRLQALTDGMIEAGILVRYERLVREPRQHNQIWIDTQLRRVSRSLDCVEASANELQAALNIGQIALACAIGWLEFRKIAGPIRKDRDRLFLWYDDFARRPSMKATAPQDYT